MRFKENGSRLLNLAKRARINDRLDVALKSYQAIITKGPSQPFYETARIGALTTQKEMLDLQPNSTTEAYAELITTYIENIEILGITDYTAVSIREMAQIYALHLDQASLAITWLTRTIDSPGMDKKEIALSKIDMGDYLLFQNRIWTALIYYMQAEKAFKYEPLGDLAKLKAAKVYYYTGDFPWALAKLNVLKGATSKLISNDALYISNLITDNTVVDTNLQPMKIYAQADLWYTQQHYQQAELKLDTLQLDYPDHALADEVLFQKYRIHMAEKNYSQAAVDLHALQALYPHDILGDDAVFKLAELYSLYLNQPEKAMEYYLLIMTDYTDSVFVIQARKRYRLLRGDAI